MALLAPKLTANTPSESCGRWARALFPPCSVCLAIAKTAAKLLGEIGIATPEVIRALRPHVDGAIWPPAALGLLGDFEWLAQQSPPLALAGLAAPLKGISTAARGVPLDYSHLTRYLDRAGKRAIARAEQELEPGSSGCEIAATDVDEALRGLVSRHAVIRWHACGVLGERALGTAAGKRILPALAERLRDEHRIVRRLAVLSLSAWKGAAKPYRSQMATLAKDPDEVVRRVATSVLGRV